MTHLRHLLLLLNILPLMLSAESVTYRIVEYNADAGSFTLAACGLAPKGSYAIFENDYGATRGNRYNQIPRGREATLWLEGWDGCTIESITLWMCSNNSSGTAALTVTADSQQLLATPARDFASTDWLGHWLSKDHGIYAPISKTMDRRLELTDEAEVAITLRGGTPEGSVYLDAVTIDFTPSPATTLASPLGWRYEKLEAKSTLADGDIIMLYRSGAAAADLDGMATSRYLDAVGLASTTDVSDPFICLFTAHNTTDQHWTLTDQHGRQLGATAAQALAWDAGTTTWDINLGYSGATIASTNERYGTLRYNAPAESWARFLNYTSNSLPLPYIYRRSHQLQPVVSRQLTLTSQERSAVLAEQDTLMLHPTLLPATTTDWRLDWTSSDETVATVRGGIVFLHTEGETIITASALDGGATASCRVVVGQKPDAILTPATDTATPPRATYHLNGTRRHSTSQSGIYIDANGLHLRASSQKF